MQRLAFAETKRIRTGTIQLVLASCLAALIAPGVAHARPSPGAPLNATICKGIGGLWTPGVYTCTIPSGISGVVSSSFKINGGTTLDIIGSLTIDRGATVSNAGTIIVHNVEGPVYDPGMDDSLWKPGLLVFGALDNAGKISIENEVAGTEGITVSYSLDLPVDPLEPLVPEVVFRGVLTNSGTIDVVNQGHTRGIKNIGSFANTASGIITIANTLTNSVGVYNRRGGDEALPDTFKLEGIMTNAGTMTIVNSGLGQYCDPDVPEGPCGYGVYNQGLFTISATGTFAIGPSPDAGDNSRGLYNGGSITSYGTFTNARGVYVDKVTKPATWGSYNYFGTMINYGTTEATGTWYNLGAMINIGTVSNGTVTTPGLMWDDSGAMLNYGTIYNYGYIRAGSNYGICIEEPSGVGGC